MFEIKTSRKDFIRIKMNQITPTETLGFEFTLQLDIIGLYPNTFWLIRNIFVVKKKVLLRQKRRCFHINQQILDFSTLSLINLSNMSFLSKFCMGGYPEASMMSISLVNETCNGYKNSNRWRTRATSCNRSSNCIQKSNHLDDKREERSDFIGLLPSGIPSSHLKAPSIMVAEEGSDLIKKQWLVKSLNFQNSVLLKKLFFCHWISFSQTEKTF